MTSAVLNVWVVADAVEGAVPAPAVLEALTPALALARAWGGGVRVVLFAGRDVPPAQTETLLGRGATHVTVLRCADFERPEAPARVDAIDALLHNGSPHALLVVADAATAWWSPYLAGRRAVPIATGCLEITATADRLSVRRETLNGVLHACHEFTVPGPSPIVLVLASGSWNAAPATGESAGTAEVVDVAPSPPRTLRHVRRIEPGPGEVNLEDAEVVVAGGAGLRDAASFAEVRELAHLVGGAVGASRVAVDAGWARPEEQVGLTGRRVAAGVYLAFGISGSREHLAGVADVRSVVSVNTDQHAPIARASRLFAVSDARPLLRALIVEARRRGADAVADAEPVAHA